MAGSAANKTPALSVQTWTKARHVLAVALARSLRYWTRGNRIQHNSARPNAPLAEPLLRHLTDDKLCRRNASDRR